MKIDFGRYVANCLACLQVNKNHQKIGGEIQPLCIPMTKWDEITMYFVTKLPQTSQGHDSILVVVNI